MALLFSRADDTINPGMERKHAVALKSSAGAPR
jgi:hypothetical protein